MAIINLEKIPAYYHSYIKLITEESLKEAFANHCKDLITYLRTLPLEKWNYSYAPEKWSIKEVVQHIIDAERIFCYRALTFARFDDKVLPGFDENHYAEASGANNRKPEDLIEELELVQKSSAKMFENFNEKQLQAEGIANNNKIYVAAIGYIIVGHCRHHHQVILERYMQ